MSAWAAAPMYPDTTRSTSRLVDQDAPSAERVYATLIHLTPFAALLVSSGLLWVILPLILWQVRRKESPFLDDHGKEVVNFQISFLILSIALFFSVIGVVLLPVLVVVTVVGIIRGAIAAHRGEFYRYPCCIRLIR